jgi:hypothetical protein
MDARFWFIAAWLAIGVAFNAVAVAEHFNQDSLALNTASFVGSAVFVLYSAALGLGLGIAKVVRLARGQP